METLREKIIKQIELQEKIQKLSKINIVECGNCGTVLLHEIKNNQIDCYACGNMMDSHDCPDYWYKGLENNEEFNK